MGEEENGRNRIRRLLASSQEEKREEKPCFLFAPTTFLPFFPNASLRKIGGKKEKSFLVETLPPHFLLLLFLCISTIFSLSFSSLFACVRKSANLMTFGLVQIPVLFTPFCEGKYGREECAQMMLKDISGLYLSTPRNLQGICKSCKYFLRLQRHSRLKMKGTEHGSIVDYDDD